MVLFFNSKNKIYQKKLFNDLSLHNMKILQKKNNISAAKWLYNYILEE